MEIPATPRAFIPPLTSLRYFAALIVLGIHCEKHFGIPARFFRDLGAPQIMTFFFVLSGFIMFHSYPKLATPEKRRNFYKARIARIWPLHLLAMLFAFLFLPEEITFLVTGNGDKFLYSLLQIFLLQAWVATPIAMGILNQVSWSISVEVFFYAIYPLVLPSWRKNWWKWLLASAAFVAFSLYFSSWLPPFEKGTEKLTPASIFHFFPLVRLFEFFCGLTVGFFVEKWLQRPRAVKEWQWTSLEILALVTYAAFCAWAAGLTPWIKENMGDHVSAFISWNTNSSSVFVAVFLVLTFAVSRGQISRALAWKPLVILGEATYAFYLLHFTIVEFLIETPWLEKLPTPLQYPTLALFMSGLSVLVWKYFEMPARNWIRARW